MKNDLISRDEAIDAIFNEPPEMNYGFYYAEKIKALPSVQPEIIHCRDCKHRDPEDKKCDCGHDILWQLPRQDDWYCADAERKIDE